MFKTLYHSGGYGERDPPVLIPNTEVKPLSADGTWLETAWESRTLPVTIKDSFMTVFFSRQSFNILDHELLVYWYE